MKYMLMAFVVFCIGCAPKLTRIDYAIPSTYYCEKDISKAYHSKQGLPNEDSAKSVSFRIGDSVRVNAFASAGSGDPYGFHMYYLTVTGSDSTWIHQAGLMSAKRFDCVKNRNIVRLPRAMSEDAWGRATVWVNKNSDMRIQVASDNLIDTYNVTASTKKGFTITKRTDGESVVIEIEGKGLGTSYLCEAYEYIKYGDK